MPLLHRIVVAGGGVSGLIAAIALNRQGHSVTIIERAKDEQFAIQGFHYYWPEDEEVQCSTAIWCTIHRQN